METTISVAGVCWRGGWWSGASAWCRYTSATRSHGTATRISGRIAELARSADPAIASLVEDLKAARSL